MSGTEGTPAVARTTPSTVAALGGAPFTLERVADPAVEPVTLLEMKRHLRCYDDVTVEDDDITGLIQAAREWVEDYTGRALVDQVWRITINGAGPNAQGNQGIGWTQWQRRGEILLRKSPVIAITSFSTVDSTGAETAITPEKYRLCEPDSKWPRIAPLAGAAWNQQAVKIEFRAGFVDLIGSPPLGVVPTRFKQAIKLWAEANYDRDLLMMPLLMKVAEQIIQPERADLQIA